MSITDTAAAPFPIDWNEWHAEWRTWITEQLGAGTLARSAERFPTKNFLADDVLGVWWVRATGRTVELSEVTFPDLSGNHRGDRVRYVGVTYTTDGGGTENGGLAESFADLSARLEAGTVE